jgi:signal transduction histidine kinase
MANLSQQYTSGADCPARSSGSLASFPQRRSLAEDQLYAAELNAVLASLADAVYVGDKNGIYICNEPALEMLGFESHEDLRDKVGSLARKIQTRDPVTGRILSEEDQPFTKALHGEQCIAEVLTTNLQTGDDVLVRSAAAPIYLDGTIIGAVAVNTDITETRRNETRLREAESLAAVGRLAMQIAHEINNPMQAATNLLTLLTLLARPELNDSDRALYLQMAQEQLQRTADVLHDLLAIDQGAGRLRDS